MDSDLPISLFVIPCLLALSLKLLLAWNTRDAIRRSNVFIWLFIATLFALNLGELMLFAFAHHPETTFALLTMKYVYIVAIFMSQCYLLLALDVAGKLSKATGGVMGAVGVIGVGFILMPAAVFNGVHSIGYSLTRNPGEFYWVFQLIFLGGVILAQASLIHTVKTNVDVIRQRKAKALLIGTLPIFVVSIAVALLMQLGYNINYSVVGSFAIIFLLWVLIIVEHHEQLYNFLGRVPTTAEYKLACNINRAIANFDLQRVQELAEEALIPEALAMSHGNLSQAAKVLGISRNTLTRRIEKFTEVAVKASDLHPALKNR